MSIKGVTCLSACRVACPEVMAFFLMPAKGLKWCLIHQQEAVYGEVVEANLSVRSDICDKILFAMRNVDLMG